jgi:hypothetical protein
MANSSPLDFDEKDGLKLYRAAWDQADAVQNPRDVQYEADYQNFHAFLDMENRNPDRANIAIPKIRSIIQTKLPRDVRAVIGRRPYFPFYAERDEYQEQAQLQAKMLDQLIAKAGFAEKFVIMDICNILYGTAYMENIPVFVPDFQKVIKPKFVATPNGIQMLPFVPERDIERVEVRRLRFKLTPFAPWEVRFDPYATDLSTPDGCRYLIKVKITSKREILRNARRKAYGPDFDFDAFEAATDISLTGGENRGQQMLNSLGLPSPNPESDIGVHYRVEMPEQYGGRYIDIWNDQFLLFDRPNPYPKAEGGHGLCNLSRVIHNVDPHTQASFWGNGEGKVNEVMQSALNDSLSLTFDNANFLMTGKTFYAKNRGVSPDQLVNEVGNKIGFNLKDNEKIQDLVLEDRGSGLPPEHFALQNLLSSYMDLASSSFPPSRGEESKGDPTLGEVSILKESGDEPLELNVKTIEDVFMSDFGAKSLAHIEQFSRQQDREELLGIEDAQKLVFLNPQDLPGGFNFAFAGSDRVLSQAIKQSNLIKLDQRISQSSILNERGWMTLLLEAHELDDDIDNVLISEEEELFMQEALARQEERAEGDTKGLQTPARAAQKAGREQTQRAVV